MFLKPNVIILGFTAFIGLFLFVFNCYSKDFRYDIKGDLTITRGSMKRVLTGEDFRKRLHLKVVEVEDPVYNKRKRYAGYWLSEIIDLAGIHLDPTNILVFSALDGYQDRILVKDITSSKAKPFVAVQDLDATDGWEKIKQGKEWLSPAPYYLVWQILPHTSSDTKLPWPYQMVAISVGDIDEAQKKLFPDSEDRSESVKHGYIIFRQNCLPCHSLNLEGGILGPELNVPRNIFEYRDRGVLREFIKDPGSFRAKDKMPSFGRSLSSQSLEDVLDYLSWMGKHKIPLR